MSSVNPPATPHSMNLMPYQASFVDLCSDKRGSRVIVLFGPVGTGKSRALIALLQRKLHDSSSAQVLLLGTRALVPQFCDLLRTAGVRSLVVDRYTFREML